MATRHRINGLYVIIDPDACGDRSPLDVARRALEGGATVLQWRDKRRDKGEQIADARAIAQLCIDRGALLIINDHADLVAATGAHGLHLGQQDLPLAAARALLGPDSIIGVSTNNADEAVAAEAGGADYVAVGAIFPTSSKVDTRPAGLDRIRAVKAAVHVPVVAIGGINATNIAEVIAAGADSAAVISAVCGADDVSAAASSLVSAFQGSTIAQRRSELRAIIGEYVDTLNRRDRAGFIALFAPDGIIQDPADQPPHIGHEAIGQWWDALFRRATDYDLRMDTTHITSEEAAITWTLTFQDDGEARETRGVEILSFDGDSIASCQSYWSRDGTPLETTRRLVDDFIRSLNDRDRAAYLALFADEAIQQEPVGTMPRIGLGAISAWWDARMAVYSSYKLNVSLVCGSGPETAVAWNLDTEVDGATFGAEGVDILTIDQAGRIASVHSYWEEDEPWPTTPRQASADASQRAIAHRFIDVVNGRDREDFLAMFVDDCVAQVPYHDEPFVGIEGLGKWWDHAMPHSRHDLRLDRAHAVRDEVAVVWTDLDQSPGTITAPRGIEVITTDHGRISGVTSYRPLRDVDDQRPYAMAEAYVAAINARDRAAFLALWSEHGMRQDPPHMIPMIGIDAIGQVFDQMLLRFANHVVSIETTCVAGNEAAIATHVESRDGTAPSIDGVIVIALDNDGKIASLHGYWEPVDVVQGARESRQGGDAIREVVVRLIEILNSRHRDRFLRLVADDCVIQIPSRAEPFVGVLGAEEWWDETIPAIDLHLRLDGLHIVGNDVVIVWSNHDRPPGSTSAVRGIDLLTIEDGRLSAVSAFRTLVHDQSSRLHAVAQAFTDALNARDREAFLSLWAEDAMRQDPPDMIPIIGIEAIAKAFDEMLVQFPDYTMSIETVCVSGNEAAIAWRTENRAGDAPPVVTGVVIIAVNSEGKIASLHAYWGA